LILQSTPFLNRKKLVKTSQTPGKTQEINVCKIINSFVFADLPGYDLPKFLKQCKSVEKKINEDYAS
jgi:GTP-binding protein